jgi:co-chaperonin GroES (HSP10)
MKIEDIKLLNNNVLLKPVFNKMERVTPSGIIIGVPSHTKDQYLKNYSQRHFWVIKTPEKFTNPDTANRFKSFKGTVTWGTTMELMAGDMVWVVLRVANSTPRIEIDGEEYLIVNYTHIFVAQRLTDKKTENTINRDGKMWDVIPINGYIICETLNDEQRGQLDVLYKLRKKPNILKVKYIGTPNKFYCTITKSGFRVLEGDNSPIKTGDYIYTEMPDNKGKPGQYYIPIEGEYFHDFNKENRLFAIDRRFVTSYING